jgi:hypothetical protein
MTILKQKYIYYNIYYSNFVKHDSSLNVDYFFPDSSSGTNNEETIKEYGGVGLI